MNLVVHFVVIGFVLLYKEAISRELPPYYDPNALFYASPPRQKATFFEAVAFCYNLKMEAASINSKEENTELFKYLQDGKVRPDTKVDFWIGGTNLADPSKEDFSWYPSGKPLNYSNLLFGALLNHNCLKLHFTPRGSYWKDEDCFVRLRFLCKKRSSFDELSNRSLLSWFGNVTGVSHVNNAFQWLTNSLKPAVQETSQAIGTGVEWFKEKLLNAGSSTVSEISNVLDVIKGGMDIAQAATTSNLDGSLKILKEHLDTVAYALGHSFHWSHERTKKIIKLAIDAVDNIFNAKPPDALKDEKSTDTLTTDPSLQVPKCDSYDKIDDDSLEDQ